MLDDNTREPTFEELEAKYAESYQEMFDESSYMDEAEIDVLLSKEEKEAQARWKPSIINTHGRSADILGFKSRYQKCEGVCHSALVKIPPIAPRAPSEDSAST